MVDGRAWCAKSDTMPLPENEMAGARGTATARSGRRTVRAGCAFLWALLVAAPSCGSTGKTLGVAPISSVSDAATPETASTPDAATSPQPGPAAVSCDAQTSGALSVVRLWEVAAAHYGLGGVGMFGIAPDGSEVILSGSEYAPGLTHYSAADGAVLRSESGSMLWRDRAWAIQGESGSTSLTVRSLATGQPIMTLDSMLGSLPSGDGSEVITFSNPNSNQTTIQVLAVPSGDAVSVHVRTGFHPFGKMAATSSGDAVLYSAGGSGELHRLDLAMGADTSIGADPDSTPATAGDDLAISLSPGEHFAATVGRDSVLRIWSYPGLQSVLAGVPTAWTRSYLGCYCTPRTFAPTAWSSDDKLFAAGDSDGNTVIRRVCDGAVVATVPSPTPSFRPIYDGSAKWGPVFLAFGPNDAALAVFYQGSLAMYRVGPP